MEIRADGENVPSPMALPPAHQDADVIDLLEGS